MAQVAKAKPDGYTILMALSSLVVLPEADKVLGRAPAFQVKDLEPIARITADPTVLAVRADSPWKTYAEFVAVREGESGQAQLRLVGELRHDAHPDGDADESPRECR